MFLMDTWKYIILGRAFSLYIEGLMKVYCIGAQKRITPNYAKLSSFCPYSLEPLYPKVNHKTQKCYSNLPLPLWVGPAMKRFSDLLCLIVEHMSYHWACPGPVPGARNTEQTCQNDMSRYICLSSPFRPLPWGPNILVQAYIFFH